MKDALVLYNGVVVYFSEVSEKKTFDKDDFDNNLSFFNYDYDYSGSGDPVSKRGILRRFKNRKSYLAIFDEDTKKFVAYYDENQFWEHYYINRYGDGVAPYAALGLPFFTPFVRWISMPDATKVYFISKRLSKVGSGETMTLVYKLEYGYKLLKNFQKNDDLNSIPLLERSTKEITLASPLTDYGLFLLRKGMLIDNAVSFDIPDNASILVYEVLVLLDSILKETNLITWLQSIGLYTPLEAHLNIHQKYNSYSLDDHIIDPPYHSLYTQKYFSVFRLNLLHFWSWVSAYKDDYSRIDNSKMAIAILNLFNDVEISNLSYDYKKELLYKILKGSFWIQGGWGFNSLSEEDAILKLISSMYSEGTSGINYSDINKFMDLLAAPTEFDSGGKKTLYEYLYDVINDPVFFSDDGSGNQGKFVKAVYSLWYFSRYNPLSDGNVSVRYVHTYTSYNAVWQFEDRNIKDPKIDRNAAPLILNYESEKNLIWYFDNYKFRFENNQIVARREAETSSSEALQTSTYAPGIGLGRAYDVYGTYHIFQPVSVLTYANNDTAIRMPVSLDTDPCTNKSNINNNIPVFYLKYLDDLGDYSDFKSTIGVAVDVALTFTGVGNLAKLRHLKNSSILRRALLGGAVSDAEKAAIIIAVKAGLFATWEILIGVASLVHSLKTDNCVNFEPCSDELPEEGTPEYEQWQQCQAIEAFLFALDILTLSGDAIARRFLRKKSQELLPHLPSGFDTAMRTVIDKIGDADSLFVNFRKSLSNSLRTKVDSSGWTSVKKNAFMFEFEKRPNVILKMDANTDIVDNWGLLFDRGLDSEIGNIDVLTNSSRVSTIVNFKDSTSLFSKIPEFEKRIKFIDEMLSINSTHLGKFVSNPDLFDCWSIYHQIPKIKKDYLKMSRSGQISFLETFGDVDFAFREKIRKNGDFLTHWDGLSDVQRAAKTRTAHFFDFYQDKVESIAEARFGKANYLEPDNKAPRGRHELRSWADTELEDECSFRSSKRIDDEFDEPGDAYGLTGKYKGKFVDWLSLPEKAVINQYNHIDKPSLYDLQFGRFLVALDSHVLKTIRPPGERVVGLVDYIILDMRYFTPKMKDDLAAYISSHPDEVIKKFLLSENFVRLNP